MNKIFSTLFLSVFVFHSCSDFLDEKSDLNLAVPTTVQDMESLLNYANTMNIGYAIALGELSSDNLMMTVDNWKATTVDVDRAPYMWDKLPMGEGYWASPYWRILNANVVIENIDDIEDGTAERRNHVKGSAYFFRALSFFDLLQIFSRSFEADLAAKELSIVLRLSGDLEETLFRVDQYTALKQIEEDLLDAAKLMGDATPPVPTLPSKATVYGLLSKYYLMLKEYEDALKYADLSLRLRSELLDLNKIADGKYPFDRYNPEVLIYFLSSGGTSVLSEARARISPQLYSMYEDNDRRKKLFFTQQADGYYSFTGDYSGNSSPNKFCGITTAEILLTRAECYVRQKNKGEAIRDMNHFVHNRYESWSDDMGQMELDDLLFFVLAERRKELVFRGVRWFDLKRLSADELGFTYLERDLGDEKIRKELDELKAFRFLIPQTVIDISGMEQ